MLYILIISIFYCIIVNCNDASLQERTFWLHHCQYFRLVGWFGYEICGPTRLLLSFTHMFLGSKLNFFGFGPCRPLKRISFITQVSSANGLRWPKKKMIISIWWIHFMIWFKSYESKGVSISLFYKKFKWFDTVCFV